MIRFLVVLSMICFFGCAHRLSVVEYGSPREPKTADAEIEIFNLTMPTRPFKEIGEIEIASSPRKSMKKILWAARRMGADAVILQGSVGTKGTSVSATNQIIVSENRDYGKRAVAIVYTDSAATAASKAEAVDTSAAPAGAFR